MRKSEQSRVLVAEDDYLVSEMVQGLLEELGYETIGEATTGVDAVEMTARLEPDVVLMDIRLRGLDGIEATRRIQARCPTPVVVLTAYETDDLVREASQAGVGAYLVKPPDIRELERAIIIARARFQDLVELRRLNADLEKRNEELDAFTYIVAHDLQNPLANMIGFCEVLEKHCTTMPIEELQRYLRTVEQIGHKLSDTIDQLLLLARAHRTEIDLCPLDMGEIVAEAQQRLANMIESHSANITTPKVWPVARGHAPWIEEVWVNYISNAIKHGPKPPQIELGAGAQQDGMIRFWIRDNGPGISEEDQARLFTPFTRLSSTDVKGYGLGLAIVRRIVEKLGGQAAVESRPGRGSVFSFTLPAATPGTPAPDHPA